MMKDHVLLNPDFLGLINADKYLQKASHKKKTQTNGTKAKK